jgi:hypothetical protein
VILRAAQLQQCLGSILCLYQHSRSVNSGGKAHTNDCDTVDAVCELLVRRRTKDNPNRIFAILDIGDDAFERPIFGLYLIAHIRSKHLQSGMCASIVASGIG